MSDTVIWLGIWTVILWGIGHLRLNLMVRRVSKVVFFPGLAIEALIRAIACYVTATPIEKFRPFSEGTPFLRTGQCPVKRIGVPIAMAIRLSLTFIVTLILLKLLVPEFTESSFALPTWLSHPQGITGSSPGFFRSLTEIPGDLALDTFAGWAVLYILVTTAMATGLSTSEFFAAIWGWAGVLGLSYGTAWLGVKFEFLSRGWFLHRWYLPDCWTSFSLLVTTSAIAFLVVATFHAMPGMAVRFKPKPTSAPQGLAAGKS